MAPLSIGDFALGLLLSASASLAAAQSFGLGLAVAGLVLLVLWVLWLDAALYGCFTFELGLHGLRDVVLSNLISEVFEVRWARRFFVTEIWFTLLPLLFILQLSIPFLPIGGHIASLAQGLVFSCLALSLIRDRLTIPSAAASRAALVVDLVRPRRPRIAPLFSPRREHRSLLGPVAPPLCSAEFGGLSRASIILFTFESLGHRHVEQQPARMPFLSRIAAAQNTRSSAYHISPAPLTNAAHVAWYFSRAALAHPLPGRAHLDILARAGYRTIYLTAANTAHYGLQGILQRAGFQHILDARQLADAPDRRDRGPAHGSATDSRLFTRGLSLLRALLASHRGPVFLHVHAQNAHIPYRIEDRRRFADRDLADDRQRFLAAQEETDALFARLHQAVLQLLADQGEPAVPPLFILSSDHGQSFGEHGYFSHGSAVAVEQTVVPLYLQHPHFARCEVPFSSHYDLLPTLLDWAGLPYETGQGQPLTLPSRRAGLLLHDGKPSRPTSGCLGLIVDHEKYSLDLVRDTLLQSDWQDEKRVLLEGEDRRYFETLIAQLSIQQGIF